MLQEKSYSQPECVPASVAAAPLPPRAATTLRRSRAPALATPGARIRPDPACFVVGVDPASVARPPDAPESLRRANPRIALPFPSDVSD